MSKYLNSYFLIKLITHLKLPTKNAWKVEKRLKYQVGVSMDLQKPLINLNMISLLKSSICMASFQTYVLTL